MAKRVLSLARYLRELPSFLYEQILRRTIRRLLKQLVVVLVAATLTLTGVIFISIGVAEGLSTITARWAAYSLVGLTLALIGLLLLVISSMSR